MVDTKEQDKEPIMISAIQHWSYCPRQCGLIHVEQVFDDNVHTMRGNVEHERVDDPGFEVREGVRVERALPVWSDELGLVGKCDIVEFHPDGIVYPIEYKHGKKREKSHDDLQLAAQAICLEEMTGKTVPAGAIFHHGSRRRREVIITPELRGQVKEIVSNIREMLDSGKLPPPAADSRCKECSLLEICQPRALDSLSLQKRLAESLFEVES